MNFISTERGNYDVDSIQGAYEYLAEVLVNKGVPSDTLGLLSFLYRKAKEPRDLPKAEHTTEGSERSAYTQLDDVRELLKAIDTFNEIFNRLVASEIIMRGSATWHSYVDLKNKAEMVRANVI